MLDVYNSERVFINLDLAEADELVCWFLIEVFKVLFYELNSALKLRYEIQGHGPKIVCLQVF